MNTDGHGYLITGVLVLCVMSYALCVLTPGARLTTQDALIVDFSKKPSANPYQELYEKLLYPTVRIKTTDSTGSGVIFNHKDSKASKDTKTIYVLTAAHVVGDESTVTVEFFTTENTEITATVVITDTAKDLALLTTDAHRLTRIYSATLAPKDYIPYLFHPVWAVGCSLGLEPRPSFGQICVIRGSYWEVSSPILPGNSGGPVFDARSYEVIGIAVWVRTHNGQLITTMAGVVPIQTIYEFLKPQTRLRRAD